MKFDLHTHHDRCGHAVGKIEDYIQAAIKVGLQVIGISDHTPFFASPEDQPFPGITMAKSEFPNYVHEVLRLKEVYQDQIEVLLGVEADFLPESIDNYQKELAQYPFDYVIGSVHQTDGKHLFDRQRWKNLQEVDFIREKELYFSYIQQ